MMMNVHDEVVDVDDEVVMMMKLDQIYYDNQPKNAKFSPSAYKQILSLLIFAVIYLQLSVFDFRNDPDIYGVILGEHDLSVTSGREVFRNVTRIEKHPFFDALTFDYDVAVLEVK